MSGADEAPATVAETMVYTLAREAAGLGLVAHGIATPLVTGALMLAKLRFDPGLRFLYAIGNSVGDALGPCSLTNPEAVTLAGASARFDFVAGAGELLPHYNPAEFFRPAQVDPTGATNNVVIGSYEAPRLRLPGAAGIPDVSGTSRTARLYVPRHSARVFVERLDFCSGVGAGVGPGPARVFTDLCTMVLRDGRLGVEALMPGVSLEQVAENTGFELAPGPAPALLPPPDPDSLRVLRREIDPRGLRDLDFLPARQRMARMYEVCRQEEAEWLPAAP